MKLKSNIGTIDGLIRAALGIAIFVFANFVSEGMMDGILEIVAAVLVLTAVSGYSPIYSLIGFSTRKPEQD